MVEDFRTRPLDCGSYYYPSCDALTRKVRKDRRVVKTSVLLATGVNNDVYRELLGMHFATAESTASWNGFFRDLKARGLGDVYLVTSNANLAFKQRCLMFCQMPPGSGAALNSLRTSRRWYRRPSGRHYRRCSTRSSNNPMLKRCGLSIRKWWNSARRNSRMQQTTWKNILMMRWRLPTRRSQHAPKSGRITPPNGSIAGSAGADVVGIFPTVTP